MSYYPTITIICARCGKQHEYSAKKKTEREAEWWKEWAESHYRYCPDCDYQQYQDKKKSERDERIRDFIGEHSLPELTGTPRQIEYAEKLRADRIERLARIYQGSRIAKWFWEWLESADSSKFWIEASGSDQEFIKAAKAQWDAEKETMKSRSDQAGMPAEEWIGDHVLPDLDGSPKQAAWAHQLRQERLAEVAGKYAPEDATETFWRCIESSRSAKFWIDTRYDSLHKFWEELLRNDPESKNN